MSLKNQMDSQQFKLVNSPVYSIDLRTLSENGLTKNDEQEDKPGEREMAGDIN